MLGSTRRHRSSVSPVASVYTRGTKTRRQRRISQEAESSLAAMEVEGDANVVDADEQSKGETRMDDDQVPLEMILFRRHESRSSPRGRIACLDVLTWILCRFR
jgi:hypothetical protein